MPHYSQLLEDLISLGYVKTVEFEAKVRVTCLIEFQRRESNKGPGYSILSREISQRRVKWPKADKRGFYAPYQVERMN